MIEALSVNSLLYLEDKDSPANVKAICNDGGTKIVESIKGEQALSIMKDVPHGIQNFEKS